MITSAAERYARAQELFDATVDLSPDERTALLDRRCDGDDTLRREVEALLDADAQADSLDEQPFVIPPDVFDEAPDEQFAGRLFGPYEVVRELGRGGLGAVYLAIRSDGEYRKEVALKLIRRGLDTDDILRRFRNERQILAQLDHPNIARLIDGGTTDDGLPYFVMEYVKGEPITAYCDTYQLSTEQRLELFRKVCTAVTYAHQNLVIHRDLKPSNILVTSEGEPKLLDFGIAKLLSAEEALLTETAPGLRAMTPEYASPEQIRGEKITTASDVYSLGVLLYELLTGQKPYRLKTRTTEELSRAVLEQEPQRPSTVISTDASAGATPRPARSLSTDLDNIVLMAMRKEPERRYGSVERFAEDICRHLEGRPVAAHKDTLRYRTTKFIRRNPARVAAATLVFLTLIGGIAATTWQAKRATAQAKLAAEQARVASAERDRAQREAAKAQSINTFLQNILGFSDPTWLGSSPSGKAHERTISEAIDQAADRAEADLADQPEVLAAVRFNIGRIYATRGRVDRAEAHLRAAHDLRRKALGTEHPETMQSAVALGEQLNVGGKWAEAESILLPAVAFYRQAQSEGRADMKWFAVGLNNLGTVQLQKGDPAAGEPFLRESLAATEHMTGNDRGMIPIVLNNLSIARDSQGDVDGAIMYLEKTLEEFRRSPGDFRYHNGVALSNLAFLFVLKGDYDHAESLLRESIEMYRSTVGEESQKATVPLIHLANVHYLRGQYREAKEAIDHVIGIQQRVLTEGHFDFARSDIVLGRILTATGDTAGGETHLRRALDMRNRAFKEGHWRIAEAQSALGECLLQQRRYAEAEPLLQASHAALTKKLGPGDPRTKDASQLLLKVKKLQDDPATAE